MNGNYVDADRMAAGVGLPKALQWNKPRKTTLAKKADNALRETDPAVAEWIAEARNRPDATSSTFMAPALSLRFFSNLNSTTGHYRRSPKAKEIFAKALSGESARTWDLEAKLRYERFDYQDTYLVIPPAVAGGYVRFRIHEVSIQGVSHAVACPTMVQVMHRYEPAEVVPSTGKVAKRGI